MPLNDLLADETCDELEEEDETSGENCYHSNIHIFIYWHHMSVASVSNPMEFHKPCFVDSPAVV